MPEHEGYLGVISLMNQAESLMVDGDARELIRRAIVEAEKVVKDSVNSVQLGMDLGHLMATKSAPIPNLMDGEEKWKEQKHELFTLPGTDLSVSVAMHVPNEKHPTVPRGFMVYIRKNGEYPNVGYIHLEPDKGTVNWSCEGLKV